MSKESALIQHEFHQEDGVVPEKKDEGDIYKTNEQQEEKKVTGMLIDTAHGITRSLYERNYRTTEEQESAFIEALRKHEEFQAIIQGIPETQQAEVADLVAMNGGAVYVVKNIDQLRGVDRKKFANTLMEIGRADLILKNIDKFSGVDLNKVAYRMVVDRDFDTLVKCINVFGVFDFVTTQALSESSKFAVILEYPEKFPDVDAATLEELRNLQRSRPN